MPMTYCSCVTSGRQVHMQADMHRPGMFICSGCGAPEEAVMKTMDAMQEQYTKSGKGFGYVPESLLQQATLIDNEPGVGPRITPFNEPAIEFKGRDGRSLKELEELSKELHS